MISAATWIVWLHLLAVAAWLGGGAVVLLAILPGVGEGTQAAAAARRAHFLTSRAMEVVVVTGVLNVVARGMESGMAFSRGFVAMLSVKIVLLIVMAGLQVWMGIAWKREGMAVPVAARRARAAIAVQLVLGAVAVLLGLGIRAT
ncbi:MAG: hypothetical protein HYW08_12130 [candidate division NC10 bacterium]|nr:hypothetical protein [candidate division NC10 bacterium]